MAIEIEEISIQMRVSDAPSVVLTTPAQGRRRQAAQTLDTDAIVQECVRRVLESLQEKAGALDMADSGSLEKMIVTSFSDSGFTDKLGEMSVYINPEQYTQTYEIEYNDTQAQGSAAGSPVYNKTPAQTLQFQLIFDGTGVVPSAIPGKAPYASDGIASQMDAFLKLVFTYDGDIHSPNFLQLAWGTLIFNCRLTTLNVNYTLFKPDGTPLRAKVDSAFMGYQSQQEIAKEEQKSSPDLSHMVTVKSADTLPDLCNGIYGDSLRYIAVARFNGITDFRELTPGARLLFPPLGGPPA